MSPAKTRLAMTLAAMSVGCAGGLDEPQHNPYPTAWVASENLCEPETIVHDEITDRLIVSNICGFKKNGEGYLSVLTMQGEPDVPRWIDGLNAPAGMAILGRDLYVADLDRVQVIDLDRGQVKRVVGPFADAKAFNDLAVDKDGTIFITDSARHKVIKIDKGDAAAFPDESADFQFANGLHISGRRLYVGGQSLRSVDLKTNTVKDESVEGLADIDGIEADGQGGLIVSIVGGDVWHLPLKGTPEVWTTDGLSSTNHAYLPGSNLVLVPTGYDNTIIAFEPK